MKPMIGITCGMGQSISSVNMAQAPLWQHRLNDSYVRAVEEAGGIPVILPMVEDPEQLAAMVDGMDAIVLSGGDDLDPGLYGKRPTGKLGSVSPRRDGGELAVTEYVLRHTKKPLLGICRGIQVLNVALGGTLHIDLPAEGKLDHGLTMFPRDSLTHQVEILPGTRLAGIMGEGVAMVNSFHHQAPDRLGEGLVITARSVPDGVIEAVELPGERFVVGVQWHPEELRRTPQGAALFHAFLQSIRGE